jgi:O-antigen/teichoic acid export membrane protein
VGLGFVAVSRPTAWLSALQTVAALVAAQGALLVGIAGFYVVELVVATATDVARALVSALLALVAGVGLWQVGRGLFRGRRWARSPALVTNLILLPVAIGLLQGGRWYLGVPLLTAAVAVVVLLFTSSVNATLEHSDPGEQR